MKINAYERPVAAVYTSVVPALVDEVDPFDDLAAVLELSGGEEDFIKKLTDKEEKDPYGLKKLLEDAKKPEALQSGKDPLEDNSGTLTRRLVSAISAEEVLSVISDAYKNLSAVRMAAASGEGEEAKKAYAIIKRLNKLISRAQRKMKDLGKEAMLLQKKQRAEKREQEFLAKQIREELERHIRERKQREKTYLRDARPLQEEDYAQTGIEPMSRAELEAKVMALAQSMAQIYSPAAVGVPVAVGESASAGGTAVSDGGSGGEASVSAEGGGGEVAVAAE